MASPRTDLPLLEGGPHPSKRIQPTRDPDAPEIRPHCFICGPLPSPLSWQGNAPSCPLPLNENDYTCSRPALAPYAKGLSKTMQQRAPATTNMSASSSSHRPRKPPADTPHAPQSPSVFPRVSASSHSAAEQNKSRALRQLVPASSCSPSYCSRAVGESRDEVESEPAEPAAALRLPEDARRPPAGTVGTSCRSAGTHSSAHRPPELGYCCHLITGPKSFKAWGCPGHGTVYYPPSHHWLGH